MAKDCIEYRFVPLGERFRSGSRIYEVIPRTNTLPCDACCGCAFAGDNTCPRIACSSFDRADGKSVWFKLVDFRI